MNCSGASVNSTTMLVHVEQRLLVGPDLLRVGRLLEEGEEARHVVVVLDGDAVVGVAVAVVESMARWCCSYRRTISPEVRARRRSSARGPASGRGTPRRSGRGGASPAPSAGACDQNPSNQWPALTCSAWPVIGLARSDARNSTAPAISDRVRAGSPRAVSAATSCVALLEGDAPLVGLVAEVPLDRVAPDVAGVHGVDPDAEAARAPWRASWSPPPAPPSTPCRRRSAPGCAPPTSSWSSRCARRALSALASAAPRTLGELRSVPQRLTSIVWRQLSRSASTNRLKSPSWKALLTRMSMRPNRSTVGVDGRRARRRRR